MLKVNKHMDEKDLKENNEKQNKTNSVSTRQVAEPIEMSYTRPQELAT